MSQMPAIPTAVEALIPHGEGMRLIDTIVSVTPRQAVAQATVKADWPLASADGVGVLVLIELAAQTAGICFGWNEQLKPIEERGKAAGWLVGVKMARFHIDRFPIGACITIHSENHLQADLYTEIQARAAIGQRLVGEVHLQVVRASRDGGGVF